MSFTRPSASSAAATFFVRAARLAAKNLLSRHSPKRQSFFSQKKPFLLSVTSLPQRGHLPMTSRPEGNSTSAPEMTL